MKEDDTPVLARSSARDGGIDEDVLRSVPLPGWSIFDALFISWHDHPEPATSGGAFADTPIARIQRFRRRFIIVVGILLVLSTIHRVWSHTTAPNSSKTTASSQPSSPNRLSSLYGWRSPLKTPLSSSALYDAAPLAGYPLSSAYYAALYNASSPPARIRPSEGRMTMLQAIARSRSSAYNPAEFIINHAEIMSHVERGADPIDLIARKPSNSDQAPVLRPHVVSAVIVHSPDYDISSTQLIISMSAKYPFVREIIIWNNDFSLNINENTLHLPTVDDLGFLPPSLRVINSPSSFSPLSSPIHRRLPASHAKHLACGLAKKEVCLFLSPSLLPIHLDSLYTSFLSTAPIFSQIVSIVNAGDYYHLSHLRFENDGVDLHAGLVQSGITKVARSDYARHADMQETISRREWSRRFMHQLETLTPKIHGEEADIYWSLWMNTMPKLLTAPALAIGDEEPVPAVRATAEQLRKAREIMTLHSIRSLYSILSAQDPFLSPDPFPIAPSPPLDDSRAPCHDDKCIFESNISPFIRSPSSLLLLTPEKTAGKGAVVPDPARSARKMSNSAFDPYTHIRSIEEYQAAWHDASESATAGDFPTSVTDFQKTSNWYLAVNGRHPSLKTLQNNSTSCWITPSSIGKGSYFGLNLLGSRLVRNIKVIGSANLGNLVGRGQEDLTAESWEVWTKQDDEEDLTSDDDEAKSGWSRRALRNKVSSVRIGDSSLYVHSFALAAASQDGDGATDEQRLVRQPIEEDEDEEDGQILRKRELVVEEPDQVIEAEGEDKTQAPRSFETVDVSALSDSEATVGVRFISRDRKSQPIKVCGFDIDGWIV